jgi:hypothetical protein
MDEPAQVEVPAARQAVYLGGGGGQGEGQGHPGPQLGCAQDREQELCMYVCM